MPQRCQGRLLAGMAAVVGLLAAGTGCQSVLDHFGCGCHGDGVDAFAIRSGGCCGCQSARGGLFSFMHPTAPAPGTFVSPAGPVGFGPITGVQGGSLPTAAATSTNPTVTVAPGGFVPLRTAMPAGNPAPAAVKGIPGGVPVGTPSPAPVMLRPVPPGARANPAGPPVIASSWQPVQHLVLDPSAGPDLGGTPAVGPVLRLAEDVTPRPAAASPQPVAELGPPAGTAIASSAEEKPPERKPAADTEDNNLPAPRRLVPVPGVAAAIPGGPHAFGATGSYIAKPSPPPVPREFAKQALPPYVVEPPDILLIEASREITDPLQPLAGQHLVRPDGTISLGLNGTVPVAGLTIEQIRDAIAATLLAGPLKNSKKQYTLEQVKAELNVDVLAYNSKFYYIITDGGGYGAQVYRFPITGNETVLDALAQVNGLPTVASKKKIWLARATYDDHMHPKVFPVDWCGMVKRGSGATNYQIYPNDRLYVESDCLIRTDTAISKFLSPILRGFGATLLGASTVNTIKAGSTIGAGGVGGFGTGTGVIR